VHAQVGDKVVVHGRVVGVAPRTGTVVETRGQDGGPPFLVRYEDGHEALVFPGPDVHVEHAAEG
jgi:hypothetical protein